MLLLYVRCSAIAMLCYIEEKLGRPYEDCAAFLFVKKIVQELVLEWRKEIPN